MKELTTEQKAKAYDEALERAKKELSNNLDSAYKNYREHLENIFPELAGSEDERMRKNLYKCLRYYVPEDIAEEYIAWLEKQGEQTSSQANERAWLYLVSDVLTWKDGIGQYLDDPRVQELAKKLCSEYAQKLYNPSVLSNSSNNGKNEQKSADKVEPKFHKGDWVILTVGELSTTVQIVNVDTKKLYWFNDSSYLPIVDEECLRHWTPQDAKDGDVLFAENFDNIGGCVFIFKGLDSWKFDAEGDRAIATGYCCVSITESGNTYFGIQGPDCVEIERVHPATKEQRDALERAITNAGYRWDKEKLKLEKI